MIRVSGGTPAPATFGDSSGLRDERWRLDRLAAALLEQETLDQAAAYRAAGLEPPNHPTPLRLVA